MRGVQIRGIVFFEGGACLALAIAEHLLGTDGAAMASISSSPMMYMSSLSLPRGAPCYRADGEYPARRWPPPRIPCPPAPARSSCPRRRDSCTPDSPTSRGRCPRALPPRMPRPGRGARRGTTSTKYSCGTWRDKAGQAGNHRMDDAFPRLPRTILTRVASSRLWRGRRALCTGPLSGESGGVPGEYRLRCGERQSPWPIIFMMPEKSSAPKPALQKSV